MFFPFFPMAIAPQRGERDEVQCGRLANAYWYHVFGTSSLVAKQPPKKNRMAFVRACHALMMFTYEGESIPALLHEAARVVCSTPTPQNGVVDFVADRCNGIPPGILKDVLLAWGAFVLSWPLHCYEFGFVAEKRWREWRLDSPHLVAAYYKSELMNDNEIKDMIAEWSK